MSVRLCYETHSTSIDNERGIATGWRQGELSAAGRRQAIELGGRRGRAGLAAVFVSDLHRAVQTARIAFAGRQLPIHPDARLRECDYGDLNGAPVARIAAERRHCIAEPFPGGESYRQVVARTCEFLRDLVHGWDGSTVLVVAHSANRWALEHLLNGVPLEDLVDAPFGWQPGWHYVVGTGHPTR